MKTTILNLLVIYLLAIGQGVIKAQSLLLRPVITVQSGLVYQKSSSSPDFAANNRLSPSLGLGIMLDYQIQRHSISSGVLVGAKRAGSFRLSESNYALEKTQEENILRIPLLYAYHFPLKSDRKPIGNALFFQTGIQLDINNSQRASTILFENGSGLGYNLLKEEEMALQNLGVSLRFGFGIQLRNKAGKEHLRLGLHYTQGLKDLNQTVVNSIL